MSNNPYGVSLEAVVLAIIDVLAATDRKLRDKLLERSKYYQQRFLSPGASAVSEGLYGALNEILTLLREQQAKEAQRRGN